MRIVISKIYLRVYSMFSRYYNSLKTCFTYFLEDNGFTEFYGVESAIRGSKCISVFVRKPFEKEFEKLQSKSDGYRSYYMMKIWESEDSIKYNVSCVKNR